MAHQQDTRPSAAQLVGRGAVGETATPDLEIRDTSAIRADVLETFPYEYPGSPAIVEISTDEFTAVCPWSGLPDFGTVTVRYLPRDRILELRSLKFYLLAYRPVGIYQEHAANRILGDLVAACAPGWMELDLDYRVRGGIHTVVRVRWPGALR
ncbi:MAG TPA: preQ(1) synthase [bacterium]|nr:preQ(1) synthase [bacterium]